MENLDAADRAILTRLGYAMARAQLFEFAMLKLLEVQRHDFNVPPDERWAEIERWLTKLTAGEAVSKLQVPEAVTADLRAVVVRRNLVAHHAWRFYLAGREKRGDGAVAAYTTWFDEQAMVMGRAYNGLMAMVSALGKRSSDQPLLELWRERMPAAVEDVVIPV